MEFYLTGMGRMFYEHTMPLIARSLERLATAAEGMTKELKAAREGDCALVALDSDGGVRVREDWQQTLSAPMRPALDMACAVLADLGAALKAVNDSAVTTPPQEEENYDGL